MFISDFQPKQTNKPKAKGNQKQLKMNVLDYDFNDHENVKVKGYIVMSQVSPVSVYCDGVSCPVSAAWHSCVAAHWTKYHCYK